MDLARVIKGSPVTEKSERLKTVGIYTLTVDAAATKIDVRRALKRFFDVEAESVRVLRVRPKTRSAGPGRTMTKRHRSKKVLVTLDARQKGIDLARFRTAA